MENGSTMTEMSAGAVKGAGVHFYKEEPLT